MVQWDITDEDLDAIVNSTGAYFDLSGVLSKTIVFDASKDASVAQKCREIKEMKEAEITSAGIGSLKCKNVIHVLCAYSINTCGKAIIGALRLANKRGLSFLWLFI